MALFMYTLVVILFHQTGHQLLRFPFRPWYTKKRKNHRSPICRQPSRAGQFTRKKPHNRFQNSLGLKTSIAQVTELLSRTG